MMKSLFTLTQLVIFFIFAYLFLFLTNPSFAEGVKLKISPSVIHIQAKPPADVWTPFTLENQSDQPVSLKIGYKAFDPQSSSNGNVVFFNDGDTFPGQDKKIFEKMQIVDDQDISHDTITLGPQQKIRLRLRILLPDSEPSSDYYFSLIFLQQQDKIDQNNPIYNIENQKSYTSLQSGIGMNVLLAVGDKEAPQASIENFSAPWFSSNGPVSFTIIVNNSGNHFISSKGQIFIKNMFGQTVGKISVPASVILAGTSRTFANKNARVILGNGNLSEKSTGIVWPENFLLGIYTATLSLSLSDKGPIYERSIHFLGFPLVLLGEIVIIIVILAYVYLRVKKKLS